MSTDPNAPAPTPDPREDHARQRDLFVRFARIGFIVLLLTVTMLSIIDVTENPNAEGLPFVLGTNWLITFLASVALGGTFLVIDVLTPKKSLSTIIGAVVGLVAGLVATVAVGFVIDLIATTHEISETSIIAAVKVVVGICFCYIGITTVLQTQDDFRLAIPYVEFAKQLRGPRPMLLDTSVLIDGRILEIGETGLIQAPIVIPSFVIDELQSLADSSDRLKRARGRRGLDLISKLQNSGVLDVSIDETPVTGSGVDQMIVELAQRMPGIVLTTDTALARIAGIQGVPSININALAAAMKPSVIPGETLTLRLVKRGEQADQGVGYLSDGTMVVAEDGAPQIGNIVELRVTSSLQTSAGRMIFGKLAAGESSHLDQDDTSPDRSEASDATPRHASGSASAPLSPPSSERQPPVPGTTPRARPNRARNPRR